ncbi:uncharacterized protein LOC129378319 [Poeciliopsis prolifica]|uniref:uncharacterized protein LOC129378319 n=1 Tax=Poeciliopsis prolifica TaxID=188132 RepID=UPI0024143F63|nr:uncharacterized protein LOC129378319 [Poeciliopsis prolifica]
MPPSVGVNFQSVFTSCQFDSDKLRPPPPLKPTSLTVVWTPFFSCLSDCGTMLIKTRLGELQKFVRLTEPNLKEFLTAAFVKFGLPTVTEGVKVVDSSGTELDEDVVKDPSAGVLTIEYETASSEEGSCQQVLGGPAARRDTKFVPETVLSEEECKEAIALIKHSADEDTIKKKMKLTFDFRRNMVLDPQRSSNILSVFPRFKDVKGLVEQDFVLMFGEDVSGKFLEKWTTTFKRRSSNNAGSFQPPVTLKNFSWQLILLRIALKWIMT